MKETQKYLHYLVEKVEELSASQSENIKRASEMIVQSYLCENNIFVFGSGHSHIVAEELYMRAGGLAFFKGILIPELMLHQMPTKSTYLERLSGYADVILKLYGIKSGDSIVIISNSGRNSVPVQLAMGAKELGASVIAITSLKHSAKVDSRDASGKRLFEIADIVIDNMADYGDAGYIVDGCETPTGPISDFIGIAIAQALVVTISDILTSKGHSAPIFRSANIDGADQLNDDLFRRFFSSEIK